MPNRYNVYTVKKAGNNKGKSCHYGCYSGSALYETLYELDPFPNEYLEFSEISMFDLEKIVQKMAHVFLVSDTHEIIVSWLPDPDCEESPIPHIAEDATEYPEGYDGHRTIHEGRNT